MAVTGKQGLMSIIIVADIFGRTPALIKLAAQLGASDIIDPYAGKFIEFNSEADAYVFFTESIGLDDYCALLSNKIQSLNSQATLVGFSVGAAAIWMLSQRISPDKIKKAICYYGSQIRNFTNIVPNFDIDLLFPKQESHFNVSLLIASLAKIKNVNITKLDYFHGFMNYYSTNYDAAGYKEQVKFLCSNTR